jgi:hypothetical protein
MFAVPISTTPLLLSISFSMNEWAQLETKDNLGPDRVWLL